MGFKYFIGYKDYENVKPIYVMFPKMSRYIKRFDETKCTTLTNFFTFFLHLTCLQFLLWNKFAERFCTYYKNIQRR